MAEPKDRDLEKPGQILETRTQNLGNLLESFNTQFLDLRKRVESLEAWRSQIQESVSFGSDGRSLTKFGSVGDGRKHDDVVQETSGSKCEKSGEIPGTAESEKEAALLFSVTEDLGKIFTQVSPLSSLLETESGEKGHAIKDAEKSVYEKQGREELMEGIAEQEICEQLQTSENIRKQEEHLPKGINYENHFKKKNELLEHYTVRDAGESEVKLKDTAERKEMQVESVENESRLDNSCTQGDVSFLPVEETEEMPDKREAETGELLSDCSLKEPTSSDDTECELIEEPKGETAGKAAIEKKETKEVGLEKEVDECEKESKYLVKSGETLKKKGDECETEDENNTGINVGKETEKLGKEKDVGTTEQVEESASQSEDLFQIGEKVKDADEIEEARIGEGGNNNLSQVLKNKNIQETSDLESKKVSDSVQLEAEKSENVRAVSINRKETAELPQECSKNKTPTTILQNMDEWTRGPEYVYEKDEELNLRLMPLDAWGEVMVERNYTLEMEEIEECFRESEIASPEDLQEWFCEEARADEKSLETEVEETVGLIVKSFERKMNANLPVSVRKEVGVCVRNLVDSREIDMKRKVQRLEVLLFSETRIRRSLQGEIRRLYQELINICDKETSYRNRIHYLQEELNAVKNRLETYQAECASLCKMYDSVTLNVEREMKLHKRMCEAYKKLICERDNFKAKTEMLLEIVGVNEVDTSQEDTEIGGGNECDETLITLMEQNLVSLTRNTVKLREKVLHLLGIQHMVGELRTEEEDSSEALDDCCMELLQYLKNQPFSHVQVIENILENDKKNHDYFWKAVIEETKMFLHEVVKYESPLLTGLLLEYGASLFDVDEKGNTALHIAARFGHVSVARVLLKAGCSINCTNWLKLTPLYVSLYYGHINLSLLLIWSNANLKLTDNHKVTPLHLAALTKNIVAVQALIDQGADVNAVDVDGDTPIFNAAVIGDVAIGSLLQQSGAGVNVFNKIGSLPLHVAAWEGHLSFCSFLLNSDSILEPVNMHDFTPLHLAAMENHEMVVQLLINRGAFVNAVDTTADSPLHYAAKFGNCRMAKSLIYAGADTFAINYYKCTPLHYAACTGQRDLCFFLLQARCDVNASDKEGKTPLHRLAMFSGDIPTAKMLVHSGADMTAVDVDGLTPYDLACKTEKRDLAKWLKEMATRNAPQAKQPQIRKG